MITLRELKARKAKYGFEYGTIHLAGVIDLGNFLTELETTYTNMYIVDEGGYNRPTVKIYTDDDQVADWLRKFTN